MSESIRVFISYSHDSDAHEQRVAELADRLRGDGIACTIDQDIDNPPEGWTDWMLAQIGESDFVLVVASEGYGTRHGTKWEDLIITQTIYRDASRNTKFIPIAFHTEDVPRIPIYLDTSARIDLWRERDYEKLLRLLTKQRARVPAPIGKVPRLPAIERLLHDDAVAAEERRPIPSAIPALLREFVDRETQRKSLRDLLAGNLSRFICVLGPGGFGKSMLVHQLLNELAPDSARIVDDRVAAIAYLRCETGKTSLLDISHILGKAIGETARLHDVFDSEQSVPDKVAFLLERVTATGMVWLVLDDFEKLLEPNDSVASPDVAMFLEAVVSTAHTLRVVATTRALPVLAKRVMAVVELDEGLPEDDAVAFLRREGARLGLAEEEESVLRDVVRRVHAIPKALESVLGFLADDPTTTIRDLLGDGHTFAAFEEHDAKVGVRSLVQEQIGQQSDDAVLVLAAIGVFAAPVPAEAVRHVLPGRDCTKPLARVLHNLLATRDRRGLFDAHALVRELALKTLRARPAIGVTVEQLHERAADARLSNAMPVKEAKTIEDLRPRLQAFHHFVEAGRFDSACTLLNEAQRLKLGNWGHYGQILEMRARLDGHLQEPRLRALDLFYQSMPLIRLGRVTEALEVLEQARAIATELGDRMTVYRCVNNTAVAFFNMLNIAAAITWYERSLELVRELRNPETIPLGNLGEAYQYIGEFDKAEKALLAATELARQRGKRQLEGSYLSDRAMIEHARGRSDKAIELLTESIQIANEYGDRLRQAVRWNALAEVVERSDLDQAHDYASKALQIFDEIGAVGRVTTQYASIGILEWQLLREDAAEEAFRKGTATRTEGGREYRAQLMLALLLIARDRRAEARPFLDAAMATCERLLGWTARFFRVRYHLALALLAKGETQAALRELDRALDVTRLPNLVLPQIRLLETLAGKAIPKEAAAQALGVLRRALRP